MPNAHFWYSFSTDKTGAELADLVSKELGGHKITHGSTLPSAGGDVLIGWGAKPDNGFDYSLPKAKFDVVINNARNIRDAANKLKALQTLRKAGVTVPVFVEAAGIEQALVTKGITFPMFGRSKRHEKGAGTWECWQKVDVDDALKTRKNGKSVGYFVQFVPNKREFRIHVFDGTILQSSEKVWQNNPPAAFKLLKKELYAKRAAKAGVTLNDSTIDFVIDQIIKDDISLPDNHSRHNTKGWKFQFITNQKTPANIREAAIKAVAALGLEFGAVDCILGEDNNAYIIEVNTGPGLCATMQAKYRDAFVQYILKTTKSGAKAGVGAANMQLDPVKRAALCDAFGIEDDEVDAMARVFSKLAK